MYKGAGSGPVGTEENFSAPVGKANAFPSESEEPKDSVCMVSDNHGSNPDSIKNRITSQFRSNLEERLSRHGARPVPAISASTRRSRFQKQLEVCEPGSSASRRQSVDASKKGSLTTAMRKMYLKELFLNNRSGLSSIISPSSATSKDCEEDAPYGVNDTINRCALWALDPMEHAWMLSAVDGNYDTMVEFLAEDPSLLSRKDFISGYTVLHWLAKNGKDETLIQLLKHAEKEGLPVNVNLRGSGGLTPLHVAAMHHQYMVAKLLVGAFSAKIDVMDYSGKRAWQYLKHNAPMEMKELLGGWDD